MLQLFLHTIEFSIVMLKFFLWLYFSFLAERTFASSGRSFFSPRIDLACHGFILFFSGSLIFQFYRPKNIEIDTLCKKSAWPRQLWALAEQTEVSQLKWGRKYIFFLWKRFCWQWSTFSSLRRLIFHMYGPKNIKVIVHLKKMHDQANFDLYQNQI